MLNNSVIQTHTVFLFNWLLSFLWLLRLELVPRKEPLWIMNAGYYRQDVPQCHPKHRRELELVSPTRQNHRLPSSFHDPPAHEQRDGAPFRPALQCLAYHEMAGYSRLAEILNTHAY